MEKTISINPTSTSTSTSTSIISPEKKLSQTNPSKKAAIQSILEKYNLKTPKKSKTNAVPVEYEIKPKDASQILHISKSIASTPNLYNTFNHEQQQQQQQQQQQVQKETRISAPTSPHTQSPSTQRDIEHSKVALSISTTKPLALVDKSNIVEKAKLVSVKDLLERDNATKEAKKNEMPHAIIQKGAGVGGTSSSGQDKINIYNFIPKVRPNLPDKHTQAHIRTSVLPNGISSSSNTSSSNNASNIKRVSINPKLNEEESLNYTGQNDSQISKPKPQPQPQPNQNPNLVNKPGAELAARVIQEATAARVHSRTQSLSPIRNIQQERQAQHERKAHQERQAQQAHQADHAQQTRNPPAYDYHKQPSSAQRPEPPREQRRIQIQTNTSGGGKQSRALRAMQPPSENPSLQRQSQDEMEDSNPELRYLEAQRKELQKQQLLELQRFKQKKADIIKLNNRKKEIELMRSIEAEKNKLRKIHAKQQELNEIYKTAVEKEASSNTLGTDTKQGGGATMKKLVVNDFDIDAKRTKKNLGYMANANKFIEPTDSAHIKRGKLKGSNVVDKIVLENTENPIKQDASIVQVVDKTQNILQNGGNRHETPLESNKTESNKTESSKPKIKKELVPGEPLKYYTKKDKQSVSWPSKTELYDVSNFEDKLDVFLGMVEFFNKKQLKNKSSTEEINKELKEAYGFKKLNNFKPALLEVIYKIIIGDKIKFTFE